MKIAKTKHFAKALVASCFSDWETIIADLSKIELYLKTNIKFKNFLLAQNIKLTEKNDFLKKELKLNQKSVNFILLLIESNKVLKLSVILEQAKKLYNDQNNIKEVMVESVINITPSQTKSIQDYLEKNLDKKIKLNNVINPKIKGGFILKIGDNVVDLSVLGKIEQLKNNLNTIQ